MKNICVRESYKDKQGQEKVSWNVVGVLIETNEGKQYVKLYHMPGVLLSVFAPKPKQETTPPAKIPEVNLDKAPVDSEEAPF